MQFIIRLRTSVGLNRNIILKSSTLKDSILVSKLQIFHKVYPYAFRSTKKNTLLYLDAHLLEPKKTKLLDNRCALVSLNYCFKNYILREIIEAYFKVAI